MTQLNLYAMKVANVYLMYFINPTWEVLGTISTTHMKLGGN